MENRFSVFVDNGGGPSELLWGSQCGTADSVCKVYGAILTVFRSGYARHGAYAPNSYAYEGIGFPTDDEHDNYSGTYRAQDFQGGSIYWNKANGVWCLYWGSSLQYWSGSCPANPPY